MIAHAFTMVWRRRRHGFLLVAEIFVSFLVVFAVAAMGVHAIDNLATPAGFDGRDVWDVEVTGGMESSGDTWTPEMTATAALLLETARETPGILAAAGMTAAPYSSGRHITAFDWQGGIAEAELDDVTDELPDVLGIKVHQGRWFSREDDALPPGRRPIVITRQLAERLFGSVGASAAVGQLIPYGEKTELLVVGVTGDYKSHGELAAAPALLFERTRLDIAAAGPEERRTRPPRHLVVKVAPGAAMELEKRLVERLSAASHGWSFEVRTLEEMRESSRRLQEAPIFVAALVSGFLMLMVGLGLLGVLGQNVVRRTREIGLRLALGAAPGGVRMQILLEVMVLTAFGVGAGAVLALQLPLVGAVPWVRPAVLVEAVALSAAALFVLTAACGLYPSIAASRVAPSEALRYE